MLTVAPIKDVEGKPRFLVGVQVCGVVVCV